MNLFWFNVILENVKKLSNHFSFHLYGTVLTKTLRKSINTFWDLGSMTADYIYLVTMVSLITWLEWNFLDGVIARSDIPSSQRALTTDNSDVPDSVSRKVAINITPPRSEGNSNVRRECGCALRGWKILSGDECFNVLHLNPPLSVRIIK